MVAQEDSYLKKAYNFFFGSCPSYTGEDFDIQQRTGDGLNATYYNGTNFEYEVLNRTDPEIYFYYNGTSPSVEVNIYQFSVVWTGYLYAPTSCEYTFTANVDDGIQMWMNEEKLIDEWRSNTSDTYSTKAKLEGKKVYELRIEYYQANKDARAELYWSYEGQGKQVIPQKYLFTSIEEPLVLMGPSFMSPSSQEKFAVSTPLNTPSKQGNVAIIAANTPNSSSLNSNNITFVKNTKPVPPKKNTALVAQNNRKDSSANKPNSDVPSNTSNSFSTIAQIDVGSKMVAESKVMTEPKTVTEPEINTPETSFKASNNNGSGLNDSGFNASKTTTSGLSADLGSSSNTNSFKDRSLLNKAVGKSNYTPNLNKRPRRSGPIILKNILFDKDRYRIKSSSYDELNALVDTLRNNPKLDVLIAGHTDFAGSPIPNQKLSESRAKAVAIYLIRRGVESKRIKTKGYGGKKPLSRAPLGTEERRRNKRVEYILIEHGAKP